MNEKPVTWKIERFLAHLSNHRNDRGMMADLRHGFSEATEYRAWPHIAAWCDLAKDRDRRILLTVAAGFAIHGQSVPGGNLGSVLRKIATGDGRGREGLNTFDARFRRLLSCSTAQEVCEHLVGVLRTAERKGVPVDFARLHKDLMFWPGRVKLEWARGYWGTPQEQEPTVTEQETS